MWSCEKKDVEPARSSPQIIKAAGMLFGNLEHVTFDPEIDCPPHACYNCWNMNHHSKDCREAKSREYCCNCGRKDVRVNECERCSKAFFELELGKKTWIYSTFLREDENDEQTIATDLGTVDDENWNDEGQSFYSCDYESIAATKDDCKKSESPPVYTEPNDLFAYMRTRKAREEFRSDGINLDDTRMAERNSLGENSIISDEYSPKDLDEKESSRFSGEPLQDFLNLMDKVKHLSVGTQEIVVLQFISECKKRREQQ